MNAHRERPQGRPAGPRGDLPLIAWGDALRARKARLWQLRRRCAISAAGLAALLATVAVPPAPRLLWNASASVPVGLYAVRPGAWPAPGDLVAARLPERWRRLAAARGYLPAGVPLVKPVAALAGDEVCAIGHVLFVEGRPIARRRARDRAGRPLPAWQGCIRLRGRQLLLLADDPASFDGRYVGPTEGHDLIGTARLLWPR